MSRFFFFFFVEKTYFLEHTNLNYSGEIKLQEWSLIFNVVNVNSSLPEFL
jgi:hypothetical protein